MNRAAFLLLLAAAAACNEPTIDLSEGCWNPDGCSGSDPGSGLPVITRVYQHVTIGRGGVLAPDTLTTSVSPTATQVPVIEWLNNDSASHQFVADTPQQFASSVVVPGDITTVAMWVPGTYVYHCVIHPRMVGVIIVP